MFRFRSYSFSLIAFFSLMSIVAFLFFTDRSNATAPARDQSRVVTPAGRLLMDSATGMPAVAPLTMNFVRTPDTGGADGRGRYLIAVNSGWGVLFNSRSKATQTLTVIDLNSKPDAQVVQHIYFPSPQSANFGAAFDMKAGPDGKYKLYVSGGFENRIWILSFDPKAKLPMSPVGAADKPLEAPFIDVSAFTENAPSPNYNRDTAAVYPTGIALSPDGETLYVANNLADSLGIVSDLRDARSIARIRLQRPGSTQFVYPYDVKLLARGGTVAKVYVSLWGDGSVAVVDPKRGTRVTHIPVDRHPTAMLLNKQQSRLYVVNSNADTVSVIDTASDRVIEKINVRLSDTAPIGAAPEGLSLSDDEQTLYVANAQANAVAVISLAQAPTLRGPRSKLTGLIPTGNYPSAVAVAGGRLYVANGKGTGMENSSMISNLSGLYPNMPNVNFPGNGYNKRGEYSVGIVSGNISVVDPPSEKQLFDYTQQAMRNNGLLGREPKNIFPGGQSPFKHVVYVIRENRTYDQVFGDVEKSGDGTKADGDPSVAIFGAGQAAALRAGVTQDITPNARALALRFGLLDRFFVNAEASPDGHNWSTAAFSNDYVDKAYRWNYSSRGRTYDFEGFNRLPSYEPPANQPPVALPSVFDLPATADDITRFLKKYVPNLNGNRDIGEPETLYLWDAAQRAGLTYRNYGEFVATVSQEDVNEVNARKAKRYPDISPTVAAFGVKKSLEGHISPTARNFDMSTPDIMTIDSYRAARQSSKAIDPAITADNVDERFRGSSRFGEWVKEFRAFAAERQAGKADRMPNLSIVRLSNDHTAGVSRNMPTPQFFVAENDYALGRMVEEVSKSPYWKDTAIFVVEDDAQDGPDHVDAHRSPALVISAYNRPGVLVHAFHSTVSLIRTIELCLGMPPMNLLDANATPIDIFTNVPNFDPFQAKLPNVSLDNLTPPANPSRAMLRFMEMTARQDLAHADVADPRELNEIIWFSVRGEEQMPEISRLPAFDLLRAGLSVEEEDKDMDE